MEYLEERFPHPPLMPVYPVIKARSRLLILRLQAEWCNDLDQILLNKESPKVISSLRKNLKEKIISTAPIFNEHPYFMSEDFSLVDCCVAPILWRLPVIGIDLSKDKKSKPIYNYMQRVFTQKSFNKSLSEFELEMREST
jgi:RNA polymerase-associated protein